MEITKGLLPWLATRRTGPDAERVRRAILQAMVVGYGVLTVRLGGATLPPGVFTGHPGWQSLLLGLLASGGSGFWNAVRTDALQAKAAGPTVPPGPTPPPPGPGTPLP